jgi:hypothetical protein
MYEKMKENRTMDTPDEEDLVISCRKFASKGRYDQVFGLLKKNPVVINYLTVGELSRYVGVGIDDRIPYREIKKLRKNIEGIIFKGVKI